jgi:hypothetical protein
MGMSLKEDNRRAAIICARKHDVLLQSSQTQEKTFKRAKKTHNRGIWGRKFRLPFPLVFSLKYPKNPTTENPF